MSADLEVERHYSITDVNENQWNNLVTQSDLGSIFHRHEWLRLVEETLDGYDPLHVVVYKGGNPVALLPNFSRDVHVPHVEDVLPSAVERTVDPESLLDRLPLRELASTNPGFGGPVIGGDEEACLELLFDELERATGPDVLFHTIRTNDTDYVRYGKWLAKRGYEPTMVNCRFQIDLTRGWKAIRDDFQRGRRRALRDADDRSVEVVDRDVDRETVDETYESFVANVERVGGNPFPKAFYERLLTDLDDRVEVFSARVDGEFVGTYVHLRDDESDVFHFYLSALPDSDYFEYHPSEVLHRHAIKKGIEAGYRRYDFGGTGAHFAQGGFRYKERYGGEAVPTMQWQKGHSRVGWSAYRFGRRMYQRSQY